MLWTVAVILAMLWLLGFVAQVTFGGFLHVLLLIAVIAVFARVMRRRTTIGHGDLIGQRHEGQ
jgi:hypothetical protein